MKALEMVPPLDWEAVWVSPWQGDMLGVSVWIVLMGFLVSAACGLVGNFLLLRRLALMGDAVSHSLLPGLVVAFLVFRQQHIGVALVGALAASWLAVLLIGWISRYSRLREDAAMCIVFTTMFALGVAMMSRLEAQGTFHLDAECVLYGELAFVAMEVPLMLGGLELGPPSVWRMGGVLLLLVVGLVVFYKEWVVTSFDAALAQALGLRPVRWHYALMGALALVVVAAFEAVGVILAVAMLIVPGMFAAELTERLPWRLVLTVLHAFLSAWGGYGVSLWLGCSPAGAMVAVGSGLFVGVWGGACLWRAGLGLWRWRGQVLKGSA